MGVYPENSLDSFEEAAKGGAYAIETDLHMTSDGTLVCIHDAKVDCTTNGTGLVDDLTTDEISALQIDVGNGISSCTRKKIPTLREYLNICKQYNCVAVIEIKRMYHKTDEQKLQMMNMLWNEIRAAGMKGQCVISSYYVEYLELFRQVDPSVTPVAYLYSSGNSNSTAEGVSRVNALANSGVTLSNAFGSRVTKDYNPITQITGLAWKTFHTCTAASWLALSGMLK
jgi:glycerophosphoryl diester phosphodiesterase